MSGTTVQIPLELLLGFIEEALLRLSVLKKLLAQMDLEEDCSEDLAAMKRDLTALRDNASFFGLARSRKLAVRVEKLLDATLNRRVIFTQSLVNLLKTSLETLEHMLMNIRSGRNECSSVPKWEELMESLSKAAKGKSENNRLLWASVIEDLENMEETLKPQLTNRHLEQSSARELYDVVERVLENCKRLASCQD